MNIFYKRLNKRGFTLIELIVVIAVLAIVITMAVPNFLSHTQDARFVKACSDAKVVSDVILQKIAMAGGAAPIDESTSYAAGEVASAIGDNLYDSTGHSVAGVPAGTYYPIDKAEIQNLISEDVDLSNMVMDQDGNLYFAAAAPGDAGEEIVGHVPFPDTVTPVEIAKAAGNLLIYNTVKQVNDSVGGTTDDAHAVYETIKTEIEPKIENWWNSLSAEDQHAFAANVQADGGLTISNVLPTAIISNIIVESVGYTGELSSNLNTYDYGKGVVMTVKEAQGIDNLKNVLNDYNTEHAIRYIDIHVFDETMNVWRDIKGWYYFHGTISGYRTYTTMDMRINYTSADIYTVIGNENNADLFWDDETHWSEGTVYSVSYYLDNVPYSNELTMDQIYSANDQQMVPFFYPVDDLLLADVWDVATVVDADLQDDEMIFEAIEAPCYDVSCGASAAIPLDYVEGQLVDFNTGLPLNLGSDTPWIE